MSEGRYEGAEGVTDLGPDRTEADEMANRRFTYPEDDPSHPDHDPAVAKAWRGRDKTDRKVEVRLFAGMRMVRVEFLDNNGKHLDHVDFTFEEYAHVCGFKDMVE